MKALIIFSTLLSLCICGIIHHDLDIEHGTKATSYQSINFQHFHAVPTYIKKEDKHLIEHPLPAGKTVAKVEIHHGDKHYPGYAIQSSSDDSHVFKPEEDAAASNAFEYENSHQQEGVGDGYQVQEDYQHQYNPKNAIHQEHQQYYQYIPKEKIEQQQQGISHYYSYPHEALQRSLSFHHQPIVVAEQEEEEKS